MWAARTSAMITFPVDDVRPAADRLPTQPLRERTRGALVLIGDPELPCARLEEEGNLLYLAGLQAYRDHRPLVLTPDAVWLTIAQGVATHVQRDAEGLRGRFVGRSGERVLKVSVAGPPRDAAEWAAVVERLADAIDAAGEGRGWPAFFRCDFSTSTAVERMASQVILLEAHAPYYRYAVSVPCGIPTVTLRGTADDWRAIRRRLDRLPEIGMEGWAASLWPILDEFVAAAAGAPRRAFWREMITPGASLCNQRFYGWLGRLFPYLSLPGGERPPNPLLAVPHEALMTRLREGEPVELGFAAGVTPWIPARVSIEVVVEAGGAATFTLIAGLAGIEEDAEGGLCPRAAVEVRRPGDMERDAATWERMARDHAVIAAARPEWGHLGRYEEATLRLGGGRLRVLPARCVERVRLAAAGPRATEVAPTVVLADGSRLAQVGGATVLLPAGSCRPPDSAEYREFLENERDGLYTRSEAQARRRDLGLVCALGPAELLGWPMSPLRVLDHAMDHDGGLPPACPLAAILAGSPCEPLAPPVRGHPPTPVGPPFVERWADDAEIADGLLVDAGGELLVYEAGDELVARDVWTGEVRWCHPRPPRSLAGGFDEAPELTRALVVADDAVHVVYEDGEGTRLRTLDASGRVVVDVALGVRVARGRVLQRGTRLLLIGRAEAERGPRLCAFDRHTGALVSVVSVPGERLAGDGDRPLVVARSEDPAVFRVDPEAGVVARVSSGRARSVSTAGRLVVVDRSVGGEPRRWRCSAVDPTTGAVVWEASSGGECAYTARFGGLILHADEGRVVARAAETGEPRWVSAELASGGLRVLLVHEDHALVDSDDGVHLVALADGTIAGTLPLDLSRGPGPISTRAGVVAFVAGLRCLVPG